jgi:hypothetical protein
MGVLDAAGKCSVPGRPPKHGGVVGRPIELSAGIKRKGGVTALSALPEC